MRLTGLLFGGLLAAASCICNAKIVLPQSAYAATVNGDYYGPDGLFFRSGAPGMGSILFYDTVPPRNNAAYLAQRSRTWARYRNSGDPYRRFGMVYTPAAGSGMMDISDRQSITREHISRATAYWLRYFDK